MSKHRKSFPIDTIELCIYGCGNVAKFVSPGGKLMCQESSNSCPLQRKKNSDGVALKHKELKDFCGNGGFYSYDALPQETKDKMNVNKGKVISTSPSIQKRLKTWQDNYHIHRCNNTPRGVATNPELRWKRNYIPYVDSEGNEFKLESVHEWQVANLLDKNKVHWIRPKPLKLNDGRRYEPDFYLTTYDVYLDPKSLWAKNSNNARTLKIKKVQEDQIKKIELCRSELNVKIVILYSTDKRSFTWDGIKEQISESGEIGEPHQT